MPTIRNNGPTGGDETGISATVIFELLANDRRQLALQYLTSTAGAIPLAELADKIASWEGEHTKERYEQICTSLVHVHLPKLVDVGVARYDRNRETIELQERADGLIPFLELAAAADSP